MTEADAVKLTLDAIVHLVGEVRATGIEFAYNGELLFLGVTAPGDIPVVESLLEKALGAPYKKKGDRALWMNWFERFVRDVGGIRRNQTLYRRAMNERVILYAALWPWATRPDRVSVRIGVHCRILPSVQALNEALMALEETTPGPR